MAWNEPGGSHDRAPWGNRRVDSESPHDIVDAIPAELNDRATPSRRRDNRQAVKPVMITDAVRAPNYRDAVRERSSKTPTPETGSGGRDGV
ncbi:MAG: protease modulator HflK N-terminal domain-containing protein [Gammaproteobacteria bacterium]|nr:protease modulator HflK N-terminal domain-containing protein [Gammaproteobacteria bacterium]